MQNKCLIVTIYTISFYSLWSFSINNFTTRSELEIAAQCMWYSWRPLWSSLSFLHSTLYRAISWFWPFHFVYFLKIIIHIVTIYVLIQDGRNHIEWRRNGELRDMKKLAFLQDFRPMLAEVSTYCALIRWLWK